MIEKLPGKEEEEGRDLTQVGSRGQGWPEYMGNNILFPEKYLQVLWGTFLLQQASLIYVTRKFYNVIIFVRLLTHVCC